MKKWTFFVIGFCFCALVFGTLTWKLNTSSGTTTTEEYNQKIRNGLAEVNLPRTNDLPSIDAAPERISNFIHYRSGVQISGANKDILRTAERNAWNNSKRVDAAALTQILADIAIERIAAASDAEIASVTNSLRGFNAPGLPEGFQNGRSLVKLRANGVNRMRGDDFSVELTNLRNGGIQGRVAQNLIYTALANEVTRRVDSIREADPQFFGGTKSRMTPAQALLVTYTVIADDALTYNQTELAQQMLERQQLNVRTTQSSFPSPQGHRAFGDNGYIYSSPISVLLNDASVERLLTLIQARGN